MAFTANNIENFLLPSSGYSVLRTTANLPFATLTYAQLAAAGATIHSSAVKNGSLITATSPAAINATYVLTRNGAVTVAYKYVLAGQPITFTLYNF
jgi:hypothetical protein